MRQSPYVGWIRRYILFHGKRHPADMGAAEVEAFLTALAVEGRVAASTQNQAMAALLFLYQHVLEKSFGSIDALRAKRLPVVLSRDEVRAVSGRIEGANRARGGPGVHRSTTVRPFMTASLL